jgi:hypothetical protein
VLVLPLQVAKVRSALFDLSFIHLFCDAPGLRLRGMSRGHRLPWVSALHDEPYVCGGCRRHRNEETAGPGQRRQKLCGQVRRWVDVGHLGPRHNKIPRVTHRDFGIARSVSAARFVGFDKF